MSPAPESHEGLTLTRRQLVGGALLLAGVIAAGTLPEFFSDEETSVQDYMHVEGGEVLGDEQLIALLNQAVESGDAVTPHPTILRSTLHSVMKYHGMPDDLAENATHRIFLGEIPGGHDGIAGMDENGLFIVLNSGNFDNLDQRNGPTTPNSWPSLIHLIGHEGTHISSVPRKGNLDEKYGPLGTANLSGEIYGFGATKEDFDGPFDFIRPKIGGFYWPNSVEEWAAEAGRINFIRQLGEKGLSEDYTDSVEASHITCRCEDYLQPSIRDAYGKIGAQELGSVFSPGWLLGMHYEGRRGEAFLKIGEGILGGNGETDERALPDQILRASGMLGFSAFVFERYPTAPGTLSTLASAEVDENVLAELARTHQGYLNDLYVG